MATQHSETGPTGVNWGGLFTLMSILAIILAFMVIESSYATGVTYALHVAGQNGANYFGATAVDLCAHPTPTTSRLLCFVSDYDEGAYVISAQLLQSGYHLFAQVFSSQPAWFLGALAIGMRALQQPTETGGHLIEMMFGALALLGVGWTAWASFGRLAAIAAVAVLSISPPFVIYAHTIEAEMPMIALGMLAVGAAAQYARTGVSALLVLSGVLLAGSAEMKLLAVVFALPVGLFVLVRQLSPPRQQRSAGGWAIVRDYLIVIVAAMVPILLTLALISPADQLAQVVRFHLAASKVLPLNVHDNLRAVLLFITLDVALLATALLGIPVGLLRWTAGTIVVVAWLAGTLIFMVLYHPLLSHQFSVVSPPLALLAGASVSGLTRRRLWRRAIGPLLGGIAIIVYATLVPTTWAIDLQIFAPVAPSLRSQLVAYIDAHTAPHDWIIADDLLVATQAHRLVPPQLDDPSIVRLEAGYLSEADLIRWTEAYQVPIVSLSRGVLIRLAPAYVAWLTSHGYHAVPGFSGATLYQRGP